MKRRTKIITTIGPATDSLEKMEELIKAGANLFRFNLKHNTPEWHSERIKLAQQAADKMETPLGILIDLQGFEIRIGTREEREFALKKGDILIFGKDFTYKEADAMIFQQAVFEALKEGDTFLLDDGRIEFKVDKKEKGLLFAKAQNAGVVRHRKAMNVPRKNIDVSSLVKRDLESLDRLAKDKVDFIALSFVRTKKDIEALQEEMDKRGMKGGIVAKIENKKALEHIDEIIDAADAIMIARGDLGVEIPIGELAFWQREIIAKCREKRKAVITATQMLYSMTENPRPTRAEATDVANSVFYGTDAVMLSEETAMGKYATQVVKVMEEILISNEQFDVLKKTEPPLENSTDFIVNSAALMVDCRRPEPDMAVVFTKSGYTAKTLSAYRVRTPIVAFTRFLKTAEILTLYYGVFPLYCEDLSDELHSVEFILGKLKKDKIALPQKTMLVIQGQHRKSQAPTENALSFITF